MTDEEFDDVPFVAFGNDELEGAARIAKGDRIACDQCGGLHDVRLGTSPDGKESPMLQFITCEKGSSYLVGVAGKSVMT